MDRLETIRIRSVSKELVDGALETFNQLSKEKNQNFINMEGLKKIDLYRNGVLEHDLMLVLHWAGSKEALLKSGLGYLLAEIFSKFGQVNHSIWNHELGRSF